MQELTYPDIDFRPVREEDAADIVRIRTDEARKKFISPTSADVITQVQWLREYKTKEAEGSEILYVFLENNQVKGTYRLYHINRFSFTAGSWVFEKCDYKLLPKIADLLMCDLGFNILHRNVMLFDILKGNERVVNIQALKGPICINEDEKAYYFVLTADQWKTGKYKALEHYGLSTEYYDNLYQRLLQVHKI